MNTKGYRRRRTIHLIQAILWSSIRGPSHWLSFDQKAIVVAEGETELRDGNQVRGKVKDLVVWVLKRQGQWVFVHTLDGQEGWLPANGVVMLSQVGEYLGSRINCNLQDANAYYLHLRSMGRLQLGGGKALPARPVAWARTAGPAGEALRPQ